MQANSYWAALLLGGVLVHQPFSARADDGWDRAVFTFTEENDSRFSDRHYTQGLKLDWLSWDCTSENCFTRIVPLGYRAVRWKWGLEAGQQMFTPEDITNKDLVKFDRPYAGWLYGGLVFQQRGTNDGGTGVMETFRVQLGIIGPESQADDSQIWWHRRFGFDHPNGWRHQLHTEIGGEFSYDRRHRYALGEDWSVQFLPEAGCNLGNVRTDFHAGGTLRAGYHIPNEFGLKDSRGGADLGLYIFGGVYGQAVLLDVFLDGNNFRESHHVEKEPFIAETRFGVVLASRHFELSAAHVQRSFEYVGQNERDGFTSLTLTAKF